MKTTVPTMLTVLALIPLAACANDGPVIDTAENAYQIDQPITALAIDARTAIITIEAGDGPPAVKEILRSSDRRPTTAHRVDGTTLRLTEDGCGGGANIRCEVEYRIRIRKTTATEIKTEAGVVNLRGLDGRVAVTTGTGAVHGDGLTVDDATVITEAGATLLRFLEAPSSVRTESEVGAVEVRVPGNRSYAVDVATTTGGSAVSVPHDPAAIHRIKVRTQAGGITVAPV